LFAGHPGCLGPRTASQIVNATVTAAIAKAPQWIRHDLAAKDPALRQCAEESLAASITAAILKHSISDE